MAERRMFAKTIIDSDAFLDMPTSTQNLYFHLGMRADDDGFVNNPKKIQRMIGASDDDLKLLIAKKFVIPFESGVCVIKHWKIHNYIQKDRYKETVYQDEKNLITTKENGAYTLSSVVSDTECIHDASNLDTQVRLGKVSLELGENRKGDIQQPPPDLEKREAIPYEKIKSSFNEICKSYPKLTKLSDARKKAIHARFNSGYVIEDFTRLFEAAESSDFLKGKNAKNWSATFDWLICDSNMAKTLDGNYVNKNSVSSTQDSDNIFFNMLREEGKIGY